MPSVDSCSLAVTVRKRWWVDPFVAVLGLLPRPIVRRLDQRKIVEFVCRRGVACYVDGRRI